MQLELVVKCAKLVGDPNYFISSSPHQQITFALQSM